MEGVREYLLSRGFGTVTENGLVYYMKNGFILTNNGMGWAVCHDFGNASGFGINGDFIFSIDELRRQYFENTGCSIDD